MNKCMLKEDRDRGAKRPEIVCYTFLILPYDYMVAANGLFRQSPSFTFYYTDEVTDGQTGTGGKADGI